MCALRVPASVLVPHWLGHRHVTRRVIAAFPEDQLFTYRPTETLRPFGEMAWELHGQTAYTLRGLLHGEWSRPTWPPLPGTDRAALLSAWDEQTRVIETGVPGVPEERYGETVTIPWGEMLTFTAVIGAIDNEIHHRGQGMVYLREMGTAPPAFWERA
ncbi:putative damage-inducible protein DinB [Deinococcus metalli]|uniref:DNA damage-inducible protein DinB n=1 Tax=Deinococcus metalli TaxID=1141878 RepID=A0A7W8NRB8_9DEIO|nr:DinB family protein [Deinococcus metalli]MBB5375982.1 putative damage-inducible protein DinB [Deinococcus metalli]GHF41693.1 DNA damage-inducible protein DinB [Deinococcus metalli]